MDSKGEYLQSQGFDVKGSVERFCGDEGMYYSFLARFTQDPNYSQIAPAMQAQDYQGALAAVHTLKGVARQPRDDASLYRLLPDGAALTEAGLCGSREILPAGVCLLPADLAGLAWCRNLLNELKGGFGLLFL
jgi:hypothetical protein